MDVRKLRVLRALAVHGTVTAAAQALHVTPSAVSQQVTALGKEAGVRLIEPVGRRVRLTDAAQVLLRRADEVFAQLELAQADLAAFARGEVAEVRVAGFAATLSGLVLPAVRELRDSRPGLSLALSEVDPPESFDRLDNGEVDVVLALAGRDGPTGADRRFHQVRLMAERFDVALPRQHRLAGSGPLALADLADEQWIFANTDACRDIAFNACVAAGFTPTTAHTIGDWDATLTAVGMGLGVALVPRLIDSRPNHRVSIRELHDHRPQRHVIAVVRQGAQHAGHIAAVLHALAEAAERRATRGEPGPRIVQPA